MTSDRRLKRNIQSCPLERIKRLYDNCDVVLYDWIESENRPGQEEGEDPSFEPAKTQLNVDYSRIAAYNMKMIQHLWIELRNWKQRKDKKYDAVFDDGRVVSFGGIKRNGEPYQQYRDITPLRAFSKYDHGNIERKQRFYRRHGPIDTSKPYIASWFSKTFLW
ncbi:hypothetical protein Plhal304r1_c046g0126861 [Plasmopara halstedii]